MKDRLDHRLSCIGLGMPLGKGDGKATISRIPSEDNVSIYGGLRPDPFVLGEAESLTTASEKYDFQ